eukprot:scaffold84372_cov20-Prasinocladus_malaysianus.AAC.2
MATVLKLGFSLVSLQAQITHLVMPCLKRNEKALAAMAAGVWLLRGEFLDSSLVEGRVQDEAVFELAECVSDNVISKAISHSLLNIGLTDRHSNS